MADLITACRIALSLVLLFLKPFSVEFRILYLLAGFSDVLDGLAARKTGSVTDFGSKLDTAADICFAGAALVKLLPVIELPAGFLIWSISIAGIKLTGVVYSLLQSRSFPAVHSIMNKAAGVLLFIFPLTLTAVNIKYSAGFVCAFATAAALQEHYIIMTSSEK